MIQVYLAVAVIAQLGERQTEDLKVPGSIQGRGMLFDILVAARQVDMNKECFVTLSTKLCLMFSDTITICT